MVEVLTALSDMPAPLPGLRPGRRDSHTGLFLPPRYPFPAAAAV